MRIFPTLGLLALSLLGACSNGDPALKVKQFHLREISSGNDEDPFVRGEEQRRLFGAVSMAERQLRLGHYYTITWRNPAVGAPVRVVFDYRQAGTTSKVLRMENTFAGEAESGQSEFAVIGKDYQNNGRVLAWQVTVYRGSEMIGQRRSFMWR
jgi:hypothetical protein